MISDDEGSIGRECRLALGPCECPIGSPYREPPSRLYRTTSAPTSEGPGLSRDWYFWRLVRMARNAVAGLGSVDPMGEPFAKLRPFVRVYRY